MAAENDTPLEAPAFGELGVRALPRPIGFARYDLYLNVATVGGQVELECDYDTQLFDAASVRRYLAGYVRLIEQLGEGLERPLSALRLVGREDVRRLVVEYNATARGPAAVVPVHHQIESWARATPDAAAVVVGAELAQGSRAAACQLSFAELDARANAVAAALRAEVERATAGRAAAALPPRRPPLRAGALFIFLPRPEPPSFCRRRSSC